MSRRPSVSCVIPAFNESLWIAPVLETVGQHPMISEVIVVDDGSQDNTADVAERVAAGLPCTSVLRHGDNRGKSCSVVTGVEAVTGDYVLMLDSDLVGLQAQDLTNLITPVTSGQAEASVSLIGDTPLFRRLIGVDYISGQRVMQRDLLADHIDTLRRLPPYGLEVFINTLWLERFSRIAIVRWPNVANPAKRKKKGRGPLPEIMMSRDILAVVPLSKVLTQILALRRRRI